jgi:spore maturation protein CgeB
MAARGHDILFLERDQRWYAENRDLRRPDYCRLRFYKSLRDLRRWRDDIAAADAVIVGSYVPSGIAVCRFVLDQAQGVSAFYDIDTPVTLSKLAMGKNEYLSPDLIPRFDLYLSFTGGPTLRAIEKRYGAIAARALYCSVDPKIYRRTATALHWDLGYLGTYSADRQPKLERLLLDVARRTPDRRFVVAGSQYPDTVDWPVNVDRIDHLPPSRHADFYSSLGWTLNLTRADMVQLGHSPSVRLFEAAACKTPIISDPWIGLDEILRPGREIVLAQQPDEIAALLHQPEQFRLAIGNAAFARVLAKHTAAHRALELEAYIQEAARRRMIDARHKGYKTRLGPLLVPSIPRTDGAF